MSLQGTLRTLGITEVLEFLADRNASGRLDIEAHSGVATYWMSDGGVASVDFDFDRESGSDAAEATYYALAELDGTFLFDEEECPAEGSETESVPDVLGRTADVAEQWSSVEERIPTPDHWLTRTETFTEPVTVEPEWWTAIDAIGAGCSSRTLTEALGMRALDSSLMARRMAEVGLLVVGDPQDSAPAHADQESSIDADQSISDDSAHTPEHVAVNSDDLPEFDAAQYENYHVGDAADAADGEGPQEPEVAQTLSTVADEAEQFDVAAVDTEAAVRELEHAVNELASMSDPAPDDVAPDYESAFGPTEFQTVDFEPVQFESAKLASVPDPVDEVGADASTDWPTEVEPTEQAPSIDWHDTPTADDMPAAQPNEQLGADQAFESAPAVDDGWATDHGRHAPITASTETPSDVPEPSYAASETPQADFVPDDSLQAWGNPAGAPAMPTVPEPESPFSAPSSAASGLFGSATQPEQQHSDLAYLPAPEPQHGVFDEVAAPVTPSVDPSNIHAEFDDSDDDDSFGTEDRSSVLKFLRRD